MNNFSNMLTNIKNGQAISLLYVKQIKTAFNIKVLNKLIKLGFLRGFILDKDNASYIKILLKYSNGSGVIKNIVNISSPSNKVYISYNTLSKIKDYKFKVLMLSTPIGILSNTEALNLGVGGELLFIIY